MSKGRTPPPAQIDHAAQLRNRLGKAAYTQWQRETGELPSYEQLSPAERDSWQMIGHAVMDVIVKRDQRMGQVSIASTFGYATQKPYVELSLDTSPAQFSPAKAREIGLWLLEAADASESDAVLMAFARDEIGLDERRAAQLLDQFRKAREKARGSEVSSA